MKTVLCALALVVLLVCPASAAHPTSDEVKKIVTVLDANPGKVRDLCARLKADPWGKDALGIAGVLTTYMAGSSKVTVQIGSPVILPFVQSGDDQCVRLLGLYNSGLLQYALAHGGKAFDKEAPVAVAGLTELAAGYANMLRARPAQKNAAAERITAAWRAGRLAQYVRDAR